jgi:hypothetical membrane protein
MAKTRWAIGLFVLLVIAGPLYTAPGYSVAANVISELAAQNTAGNVFMAAGFVLLGLAIVADGLAHRRPPLLPFIAFGLCFGAAGVLGHRPITPGVDFVPWVDSAHSLLATLSGISLTVGFAWQSRVAPGPRQRLVAAALAVLCVALPLLMLAVPAWQGLIQRAMYSAVFAWLWVYYPLRAVPGPAPR